MKNIGADRISDDVKIALAKALEEQGNILAKKAVDHLRHAGRKNC